MEHTKEPWSVCESTGLLIDSKGKTVIGSPQIQRRIVACVNACAGISTFSLELWDAQKDFGPNWLDGIKYLVKQRDKLLEELEIAAKYHASHECYAEAKRVESFIASIKGESA